MKNPSAPLGSKEDPFIVSPPMPRQVLLWPCSIGGKYCPAGMKRHLSNMKKAYESEEKRKHFRAVACFRGNAEGNQSAERKLQSNAFHIVDIQGLLTPDGGLGVSASGNVIYPRPAMSLFFSTTRFTSRSRQFPLQKGTLT